MKHNQLKTLVENSFTRRHFLQSSAAIVGSLVVNHTLSGKLLAETCAGDNGDTLVYVFLRGGADALSILAPISGGNRTEYDKLRPTQKIPANQLIPLTNSDKGLGLHPAAAPLAALYEAGKMNFVTNVGLLKEETSHFSAQDFIEFGVGEQKISTLRGGFLNRALAGLPDCAKSLTIPAVSVNPSLNKSLMGAEAAVAFNRLNATTLASGRWREGKNLKERLAAMFRVTADPAKGVDHHLRFQGARAAGAYDALITANGTNVTLSNPDHYQSAPGFEVALKLMKSDPKLKVVTVDIPGWDTHSAQGTNDGGFHRKLEALSNALAAFATDLERNSLWSRVTVVVMSEFGRRAEENSAEGTDHGRGGVAMVIGRGLVKKVFDAGFSLNSTLIEEHDGNLPVRVDYRKVVGEVLAKRMRIHNLRTAWTEGSGKPESPPVFPDLTPGFLKIIA